MEWDPVPGAKCYDLWFAAEHRDSNKPNKGRKYWVIGSTTWIRTAYHPDPNHSSDEKISTDLRSVVAASSYDVQVRAAAGNVASPWTEIVSDTTTDVIGTPVFNPVSFVSAPERIEDALRVSWSHPSGAHVYQLQQRKEGGTDDDWRPLVTDISCPTQDDYIYSYFDATLDEDDAIPSNSRQQFEEVFGTTFDGSSFFEAAIPYKTVTGLDANTVYEFRVRGVANDGTCANLNDDTNGAWSEIAQGVTIPSGWTPTVTAGLTSDNKPKLDVSWPAVTGADNYIVQEQDDGFRGTNSRFTYPDPITSASVVMENVECDRTYYVRVQAEVDGFTTLWSLEGSDTTDTAGCVDS